MKRFSWKSDIAGTLAVILVGLLFLQACQKRQTVKGIAEKIVEVQEPILEVAQKAAEIEETADEVIRIVMEEKPDLEPVRFAFDSAELRQEDLATLVQVLAFSVGRPHLDVLVVGHTDVTGPAAYNYGLGLARAKAVKAFLVERGFEQPEKISVTSAGESRPLCRKLTRDCHAANRRVEIVLQ